MPKRSRENPAKGSPNVQLIIALLSLSLQTKSRSLHIKTR